MFQLTHLIHGMNGLPTELRFGQFRVSKHRRNITSASLLNNVRNFDLIHSLERIDQLHHRDAFAGSQVVHLRKKYKVGVTIGTGLDFTRRH